MKSGIRLRPQSGFGRPRRPTVLLADDNTNLRYLLTDVLELEGYEVVPARDGYDVLTHAAARRVQSKDGCVADLLLTDIRLPGLSGLDVMARLRQFDCLPKTIVMSGTLTEEELERARLLGAEAVLRKPFLLDELSRMVADCLRKAA